MHTFSAEGEEVDTLPSCFGSHTINKCPFHSHIFPIFVLFHGDFTV